MNAHSASLINGIVLVAVGMWGYLESGGFDSDNPTSTWGGLIGYIIGKSNSPTALIPVVIGIILLALNKGVKNQNKVIAHIAVLVTLLSFANIMPLRGALADGRSEAVLRIIIMLSSSVYAMIFFIKSFIEARRK